MRRLRPLPLFLLVAPAAGCGGATSGGPAATGSGPPPERIRIGVIPGYRPAPPRVESMIVRPAWEPGKGNP
ncbi:hypothetical protein [Nonomuraea sp. NPDC052265]|uniref:hypothetical protein n=1 Tax=Nonomuraea sp. NPDC052265 TaxID=3364374 RepID=UPI0037CC80C6